MSIPTILNQGQTTECSGFAILGALCRMKPDTDYEKIAREIVEEDGNSASITNASAWFVQKGYIKGIRPCRYSPFLLKKIPIIASIRNVDWVETGKPPYMMKHLSVPKGNSHYLIMVGPNTFQNSWGEEWGDKGYFYFDKKQVKTMGQLFRIII